MAEAKRKPGRPPGSKNKNTASGTKSSGGSGGRGNKNGDSKAKARVQEIQAERKADKRVMDEIWAIIAIAIGVFLIVATFTEGAGQFGEMIGNGLKGILGFIAYIFPFYIILYGVLLFAKKTVHISLKSGALIFIILLMMTIMNSVRFIDVKAIELTWQAMKAFYTTGVHLTSGGFVGMVSASFLIKWIGVAGCWIFAVVVTLIALLLLINTPVSRFITKIGDKMEERRLLKEHAHLDYMSEDEQGIQVAMEELAPKKLPSKRQKKVLNSSVLEDKEDISSQNPSARPVSADAGITDDAGAGIVSQPEIIISGNIQDEESPAETPEIPKREYIPPSQVEPLNQEKKNSILKYMSDDSLFGRKPSNSMGLESKTDAAAGFGLDGMPAGSGASGTTGLTGLTGLAGMDPLDAGHVDGDIREEISPVSGSNRFINRSGQKIDPGAPASASSAVSASASSASAESGGTPAAELQP
ncbi:MAG: DNA translocase FtsK 4TM domain-containing protein, partial [Anaerovoracaceae bacterium]